ncbi:hypothetical protein Glove_186g31 [Diversispora epigaea]|uniref:Uncharacterized protein n=1 Tax=Diversispora epigaea TaxID=1348612 RepID=A0A397IV71_9GLOM|nr:hypothetical protein Glove_186g31 [Diversispora epigaea]
MPLSTPTTTLQSVTFAVGSTVMSVGELYSVNHLEASAPTTSLQSVTFALGYSVVPLSTPTTTLQSVAFAVGSTVMSVGELYSTNHLETNTPTTSLQPVMLALGCLLVRLIPTPTTTLQSVTFAVGSTVMSVGVMDYGIQGARESGIVPTRGKSKGNFVDDPWIGWIGTRISLLPEYLNVVKYCDSVVPLSTPTTTLQSVAFAVGSTVMSVGELYSVNHLEASAPTTSLQSVTFALGCLLASTPTTSLQSVTFALGCLLMRLIRAIKYTNYYFAICHVCSGFDCHVFGVMDFGIQGARESGIVPTRGKSKGNFVDDPWIGWIGTRIYLLPEYLNVVKYCEEMITEHSLQERMRESNSILNHLNLEEKCF